MSIELELLSTLYGMYIEGDLAAEFDKKTNSMKNSDSLVVIMNLVAEVLPEELKPIEAAERMRNLSEVERDKAIETSGEKVIDMRKHFSKKMSINHGAIGLTEKLLQVGVNTEEGKEILKDMQNLVELNKEGS